MDAAFFHACRLKLIDYICSQECSDSVATTRKRIEEFYWAYNLVTAQVDKRIIYRVRKITADEPHLNFNDVWFPPLHKIKCIGRANDIGETMFYGAFDPLTAIAESRISAGEKYSLALFEIKPVKTHDSIVIREAELIARQNPELSYFGIELSKFMVREFTRVVEPGFEHLYRRSCALAQLLLETPHKDSLIYPSIQNPDGINIALKPDAAVRRLTLINVITCEMESEGKHRALESKVPNAQGELITTRDERHSSYHLKLVGDPASFHQTFIARKLPGAESEPRGPAQEGQAADC